MQFRSIILVLLAALLLAGCTSPQPQNSAQAPIWPDMGTVIQPAAVFPVGSPIETNPPVPPKPVVANPMPLNLATETWVPLQRWSRSNGFGTPVQVSARPSFTYAVQSTNGVFVLRTGSELAQWDGLEVRLGFAPQLIDGQPYVHALDINKTIQPLLLGESAAFLSANPVVVIDPGHGGENAGTRSVLGGHYEKEFTLDWARRLQSVLAANNCRAFLTRSNDSDVALSNRVAFASNHKADLFISLHFNSAAPNESEAGLETYCLTPVGMPSSLTRGFSDEIQQTFPNNAFDNQNLFLALRIHRALLQMNGHHDRGIRRARFPGVLRNQQRASILVEGGYLSNPQEARLIEDPAYRQRLAEAVAKALLMKPSGSAAVAVRTHPPEIDHPVPFESGGTNLEIHTAQVLKETPGKTLDPQIPDRQPQ